MDKPETFIHSGQMLLFNPWKYDVPFIEWSNRQSAPKPTRYVAEQDVAYEDIDQRLGGNDNPYDGGW